MADGRAEQTARDETTLRTLLADAHDRGSGCQLHELHHYGRATDALDALARDVLALTEEVATLRQALETVESYLDPAKGAVVSANARSVAQNALRLAAEQ